MAESAPGFQDTTLVVAPHVARDRGDFRIVWPDGGLPATLDPAAAAILDCFVEPATPAQIAADLHQVLGLDTNTAMTASVTTALELRRSGLVIAEGMKPMPSSGMAYPSGASP